MPFQFMEGPLAGLIIIKPDVLSDERGWFMETYKQSEFRANGISDIFAQDNHCYSKKNTLRGLHFQKSPHAQGKLVRCMEGVVWDVAVDLRKNSNTFMQYFGMELSGDNRIMLYIPSGFAHGFLTLSDTSQFQYKCTSEYAPDLDFGIHFNDPDIAIKWPIKIEDLIISSRDSGLPLLAELGKEFSL